jgi:predicted phage tail protein
VDLPLRISLDASGLERKLTRQLTELKEAIMSGVQNLRGELRAEMERLVEEVRQTRTATDAVAVTVAGLRDQLQNAVEQSDIEAVRAVIAGLDAVQGDLTSAAGENVDTPPAGEDTVPAGEDTVPAGEETLPGEGTVPAGEETTPRPDPNQI